MRKHRHHPRFTKAGAHAAEVREAKDEKRPFAYLMRRAHGLTPREAPALSVLASAEKRKRLYMHSMHRQFAALHEILDRRAAE